MRNHFTNEELRCPCCNELSFSADMLEKLNKARRIAGIPFVINSGYRCFKHNQEVGGKETSAHLAGLAVDIECTNSRARMLILSSLISMGFTRVGIGSNFIHVDDDPSKDPKVAWLY